MKTTTVFETRSNVKTKRRAERDRLRVAAAERAKAERAVAEDSAAAAEAELAAQVAKDKERERHQQRAAAAEAELAAQVAKDKERERHQQRAAAWVVGQRAAGWPSYARAVYALARLGVAWEKSDDPPPSAGPDQYMRSWYKCSRWAGNGLSPEDVAREILATPVS
jgi:hypothetical protein